MNDTTTNRLVSIPFDVYQLSPLGYELPRAEEALRVGDLVSIEQRGETFHAYRYDAAQERPFAGVCAADTFKYGVALIVNSSEGHAPKSVWVVQA